MAKEMESLKTFFVTCTYPPSKYPRSIQISHLVQSLRGSIDITVMATKHHDNIDLSLLQFTSLDNVVYPTKTWLTKLYDKIGGHRLKKNIYMDTFYPETRELWLSAHKLHKAENFCSVVTFGQPMSVHMVGLKLKKKFPHLKWLAHFSDPWVDNPYNQGSSWVRLRNQQAQNNVLNQADRLLFTSPETIDLVLRGYPQSMRRKAIYLPHSFNPALFQPACANEGITVRYLGNFYGNRNPIFLFEALHLLKTRNCLPPLLKIELVGACSAYADEVIKRKLEDIVIIKPSVSYIDSLKLMSQSSMLLIIDAPFENSPFFPSKLVDYIGANKPIFAITPPGASQRIVEELGFLVAHPNSPEEIATQFLKMITKFLEGQYQGIPDATRNRYEVSVVGNQLKEILHNLAK
jgi:hypothetical protein